MLIFVWLPKKEHNTSGHMMWQMKRVWDREGIPTREVLQVSHTSAKVLSKSQILLCKILKKKQYHSKILLNSFHLNGYTYTPFLKQILHMKISTIKMKQLIYKSSQKNSVWHSLLHFGPFSFPFFFHNQLFALHTSILFAVFSVS